MASFLISTDNASDLPDSFYQSNNVSFLYLSYMVDGETYGSERQMDGHAFYDLLRSGALPTTSACNPDEHAALFRRLLSQGQDLLHISFSSGLSNTYSNAVMAAKEVAAEYPDRKLYVVDSLCASLGEGFLVNEAVRQRDAGIPIDQVHQSIEAQKLHVVHDFTVDDLHHLHRGGRVSKATAIVGSLLSIKPLLHVDDAGHLIAVGKARGRKQALTAMVDRMAQQLAGYENQIVFISHGDCPEDADRLKALIQARFGIQQFLIAPVGPVIGTHSGPGTLAVFFWGSPR